MRFARLGIFCAVCVGFFPRLTNFLQVRVLHLPDEVGSGLKTFCRLLIGFPVPGDGVDESRLIRLVVLGISASRLLDWRSDGPFPSLDASPEEEVRQALPRAPIPSGPSTGSRQQSDRPLSQRRCFLFFFVYSYSHSAL